MADLPTGTVTFLYTDIEGSTRLWEQHPQAVKVAVARHDALLRVAVEAKGGVVFRTVGDGLCAAFATAPQALEAALAGQLALQAETWGETGPLRVRMALHTGAAEVQGGDYVGSCLNRIARLLPLGHGGQVLLSMATEELVRDALPASASLRDLGDQRLRDLTRPERVFQGLHSDLPADFPALRSLETYPTNLPLQLTSFVGREREIGEVQRMLRAHRLVTLSGTGGCGKTRLAFQVAADLLDDYAEGVWLADLAPLSDATLVAQTLAAALGVREQPGQPILTTLIAALKPKTLLLVLDNCEHLLDACARLVDALLHGCPHLGILATSREALGIAGEASYRVPSLAMPDPRQLPPLVSLTQYEAVRLFVDRAAAVQASFAVTNQNAPAVAEVCWRLDGIPLAIELAAARVRALPVEQIESRLNDRFRLLTGGSRTALRRQQTLRATVDWSYDLLSPAERMLLRRLAVFSGGCSLEAAETVCSGEGIEGFEVFDLLLRLVDRSLVVVEDCSGEARYRLLETIRQYAQEKLLESGEAARLRTSHLEWFLLLAERAEPDLYGERQGVWLDRLALEHDNLRGALDWALETDVESGLRIAVALHEYWFAEGHYREGRRRLGAMLARAPQRAELRARALQSAAWMAFDQGDLAGAGSLAEEMLAICREISSRALTATALLILGDAALMEGDIRRAATPLEESVALARGVFRHHLSFTHWCYPPYYGGDWEQATTRLREARSLDEVAKSERDRGMLLGFLSLLALIEGEQTQFRALLEEALALSRRIHERRHVAIVLAMLAMLALDEDDLAEAAGLLEEALPQSQQIGIANATAYTLDLLGRLALAEGDLDRARTHLDRGLGIVRETGLGLYLPWPLCALADLALARGDTAKAAGHLRECLVFCREKGLGLGLLGALTSAAALAAKEGTLDRGVRLLGAVWDRYPRGVFVHFPGSRARAESFLGAARTALGQEVFTRAWVEGQAMSLEEAVEYALSR